MSWLFFAALQLFFDGAANIIDQFLANRHMPEPWTLIFYTSFFNLLFLPVIILIDTPSWPTASQWPVLILLGLITHFILAVLFDEPIFNLWR